MEKIKALIVDDEPEARTLMKSLLTNYQDIEIIAEADNVDSAYTSVIKEHPDLLFLDIDMPQKNGFDLLREIKKNNAHRPTVIFVTAYNHFAIDAIKHAAFDYLLKPIDVDDLKKAIQRFRDDRLSVASLKRIENLLENLQDNKLRFATRTGYIFINPADVVYCQAEGNYTDLYLADGRKQTVTMNIGRLEGFLLQSKFKRINRSILINQQYLVEINRKEKICLLMVNDTEIKLRSSSRFLNRLFGA